MPVKLRLKNKLKLILFLLGGSLVASLLLASAFGAADISLSDIFKMVLDKMVVLDIHVTCPQ